MTENNRNGHGDSLDDYIENYAVSFAVSKKKADKMVKNPDKMKEFIKHVTKFCEKLKNVPVLGKFIEDIPLCCELVNDYANGTYKEVPVSSIVTIVAALIYLVSPVNVIPDVIPLVGFVDDAAVLGFALKAVDNDLMDYKKWKLTSKTEK